MRKAFREFISKYRILAWAAVSTVYRLLFFWQKKNSEKEFLALYGEDRVFPQGVFEKTLLRETYQDCIGCSWCTFSCQGVAAGTYPARFEPKQIALHFLRSGPEIQTWTQESVPCAQCHSCTVTCPKNVPLHRMVAEMLGQRR